MNKKTRKKLYLFFVFLFFTITPLVSLYATGYRFDFKRKRIQKTGTLILDSNPENAIVYINNKKQKTFSQKINSKIFNTNLDISAKTPTKIKNMLPGDYLIRLELNGYWPWEKKLSIYPGASTYAEDIVLFKHDLPYFITELTDKYYKISPNFSYLAHKSNNSYKLFDLKQQGKIINYKDQNNKEKNFKIKTPIWSNDSEKVLIFDKIFFIDDWNSPTDLNNVAPRTATNFKWDNYNPNIINYQNKNTLNQFNLSTGVNKTIIQKINFNDYLFKKNKLYLISNHNRYTNLLIYSRDGEKNNTQIKLPLSNYTFINQNDRLINLLDKKNNILYLINPSLSLNPVKSTINNFKQGKWINNDEMLYANEFEIWIFNRNTQQKNLLTRISTGITNIAWHKSNNYVIFCNKSSINALELDNRNKRNITQILKINSIKNPEIDSDNQVIYFYANIGTRSGLYKFEI